MWDVHDWFFNPAAGSAVFLFKTRSELDRGLWLEEEAVVQKDEDRVEFSLLIYACASELICGPPRYLGFSLTRNGTIILGI
ncbi:hypothetical protein V6N13_145211 [Hibiscus sabdariffa]